MDIHLIIPVYTSEGRTEIARRENFFRVWLIEHLGRLEEKFGGSIRYKHLNADAPKGLTVILALSEVLAYVDFTRGVDYRNSSYFVMIDGSGAYNYDSIILVLDKLISEHHSVVLGRRRADSSDWHMGFPWRKDIEVFENFLIEQKYKEEIIARFPQFNGKLPDAQAGCWGINLGIQNTLNLTAQGYELEFDLITSALTLPLSLSIGFTDDLIAGSRPVPRYRDYSSGDDPKEDDTPKTIDKLGFMLHKFDYTKEKLRELLADYPRRGDLPKLYKTDVENFINT